MLRPLPLALLLFLVPQAPPAPDGRSALQIKVVVADAAQQPMPVPRHVLLISDNPPTAAPRRIQTAGDGTATVRLRPGTYTVESDQPVTFQGRAYQWTQNVEVAAGRDAVLELTAGNAEVTAAAAVSTETGGASRSLEADPLSVLTKWQDSVVALWSPTAHGTGFVADSRGLIVTSQRVVGTASSVEVQLTPAIKVAARVLAVDAVRDVAVLWINPTSVAALTAVPLGCSQTARPPIKEGQEIFAIATPLRRAKGTASGTVSEIAGRVIVADFVLASGGAGGPVFASGGHLVGITSLMEDEEDRRRGDAKVVRIEEVCATVAAAEPKMKDTAAPAGTRLPVEPERPFPMDALKAAAARQPPGLSAYRVASASYDVTFITPTMMYAEQNRPVPAPGRGRGAERENPDPRTIDPLDDFSNWAAYVADFPPVLLIRATPKLVEGFWTKIARGAAQTQGVSLPPIKRFKPGFGRLQLLCGDTEVAPIHPFKLEQRVTETDAVYEGLYVFDPDAIGPACATVKLVLYSEKEPAKGETRVVDVKVLQQIREDFAPYRALK